jgi:hypothetical protein
MTVCSASYRLFWTLAGWIMRIEEVWGGQEKKKREEE